MGNPSLRLSEVLIRCKNPKFVVWMHLGMAECRVHFLGHLTSFLESLCPSAFEVGISKLMHGCILGRRNVVYHHF